MAYPSLLRFTRPRTFLYMMSLRTGTEVVVLTLLINKLTGVYGILALFTGYHLSYMQLSMYIYSIAALVLVAWLSPHVRKQSPLQCLALAWFYVVDSVINALYTLAFGVGWFLVLADHNAASAGSATKSGPGTGMMGDVAGFTNPEFTVSHAAAAPTLSPVLSSSTGSNPLQARDMPSMQASSSAPGVSGVFGDAILNSGSIASITVISALWAVRVYFILVIMAYARGVLRQHILLSSGASSTPGLGAKAARGSLPKLNTAAGSTAAQSAPATATSPLSQIPSNISQDIPAGTHPAPTSYPAEFKASTEPPNLPSPFHPPSSLSAGWPGKLGRIFVSIFPAYWLGPANDNEEATLLLDPSATIAGARDTGTTNTPGVFERERRRRAGTGPPIMLKPVELEGIMK